MKKTRPRASENPRSVSRWQFVVRCEHDLRVDNAFHTSQESILASKGTHRGNCPFCLLVQKETDSWLEEKSLQSAASRQESILRGIKLRESLLIKWACNQLSKLASHPICPPFIEIALCGQFSKTIASLAEVPDKKEMQNLLNYRERIATVGNYAAIFLQSRIRKYLCWRRVRKYMLQRFEFAPSNRTVPMDSFFDSTNGRRLYATPCLLKNERASSPRTIQRRLAAEEVKRRARFKTYVESLPKSNLIDGTTKDHFLEKLKLICYFRQIIVFKDVVMNAMTILDSLGNVQESTSRVETTDVKNESSIKSDENVKIYYSPCWVSFSLPAPDPYDLAISMALKTIPFTPLLEEEGLMFGTTQFDDIVNLRLRAMDEIAYDAMRCNTPDDVLSYCFFEDMYPIFSSTERIAADPEIWSGRLYEQVKMQNLDDIRTENTIRSPALDNLSHSRPRVLPFCLRLHPFDPSKGFFNQFRLFFYNGRLAAACQVSKYSYHREIVENRDLIIDGIISFATSISIKSFVKSVTKAANVNDESLVQDKDTVDYNVPTSTGHDRNFTTMYVPDEEDVFSSPPTFEQRPLNYDEYMIYGGTPGKSPKCTFLNQLSLWKSSYERQKKMGKPKQKSGLPPLNDSYYDKFGNVQSNAKKNASDRDKISNRVKASLLGINVEESTGSGKIDSPWKDGDQEDPKYVKKIEELSMSTDFDMKQRILSKGLSRTVYNDGGKLEYITSIHSDYQLNNKNVMNLVVLDVFVDIPRIRLQKPDDTEKTRSFQYTHLHKKVDQTESFSQSGNGNYRYSISISRVVGAFSTSEDDAPTGLDIGIAIVFHLIFYMKLFYSHFDIGAFQWSHFQQLDRDITYQGEDRSTAASKFLSFNSL